MKTVENITGGRSFHSYKYNFDSIKTPSPNYDDNPENNVSWKFTAETKPFKGYKDLKKKAILIKNSRPEPEIKFFLDGSRHVYHVDDISYNGRIFPVIAGQVGVGCCRRENKKIIPEYPMINHLVLSLPDKCDYEGNKGEHLEAFLSDLKNKINNCVALKKLNNKINNDKLKVSFESIVIYKTDKTQDEEFENRGIATIQDYMIDAEKGLVDALAKKGKFSQSAYLIKDGSLEYIPMATGNYRNIKDFKRSYQWVIGVSKSFNPESCRDSDNKPNADYIINLKESHRTPVALFKNERIKDLEFAVWYLRLRPIERTKTPFDGVIKIEKILVSDTEVRNKQLDSETVDMISATLLNERNPTCYGTDLRYANHLYPVYLTERFIKSKFINDEMFMKIF